MSSSTQLKKDSIKLPKLNLANQEQNLNKLFYPKQKVQSISSRNRAKSMLSVQVNLFSEIPKLIQDEPKNTRLKYQHQLEYERRKLNYKILKKADQIQRDLKLKKKEIQTPKSISIQRPKAQLVQHRIKNIIHQIFPLSSEITLAQFVERYEYIRNLVYKSRIEEKKIEKLIKSKKVPENKKYQILQQKKLQMQQELDRQYHMLYEHFFKDEVKKQESFKKKFQNQVHNLSKTLIVPLVN